MLAYLNHTTITKEGEVYHISVRTQECADMLAAQAESKGIKVEVKVMGIADLRTKEKILSHFEAKNSDFKEFVTELGLI